MSDLSCLSDSQQMGERKREREGERGEERRGLPSLHLCENRNEEDTMRQRQTARAQKLDIAVVKVTGSGEGEMRWKQHIK